MQSTLNEPSPDVWGKLAPLLDEAIASLGETDRNVLVLRYFENQTAQQIGNTLNMNEGAAQKRVVRALQKLRKYFSKRGISLSAGAIAGAVSTNSVQAAPAALAKTITAVALAKGAAASGSTLTLIKVTLKIMAWTKAKTVIVVSACVLLAAGTTTVSIYKMGQPMRSIRTGWSVINGDSGQWRLDNGEINGEINGESTAGDSIFASIEKYRDVTFSAIASTPNREASLAFRLQDSNNGYFVAFVPANSEDDPHGFIRLLKRVDGKELIIAAEQMHKRELLATRHWAKIKVVTRGTAIQVYVNGVKLLQANDTTFATGYIGFRIYGATNWPCNATYSNVHF